MAIALHHGLGREQKIPSSSFRFILAGMKLPPERQSQPASPLRKIVGYFAQHLRATLAPILELRRGPAGMVVPAELLHSAVKAENRQDVAATSGAINEAKGGTPAANTTPSTAKRPASVSFRSLISSWDPRGHSGGSSGMGNSKKKALELDL